MSKLLLDSRNTRYICGLIVTLSFVAFLYIRHVSSAPESSRIKQPALATDTTLPKTQPKGVEEGIAREIESYDLETLHAQMYPPAADSLGSFAMVDLRSRFDLNYESGTIGGDADAQLLLSMILVNCEPLSGFESVDELDGYYEENIHRIRPERYQSLKLKAEDCFYINSKAPEGVDPLRWSFDLLESSADGRNKIAQVSLAAKQPTSERNYETQRRLLEASVRESDYKSFYQVANYYSRYRDPSGSDIYNVESTRWDYLGCVHHPECNSDAASKVVLLTFDTYEAERILDFPNEFEKLKQSDEPIVTRTGWTEEYTQASPSIMLKDAVKVQSDDLTDQN